MIPEPGIKSWAQTVKALKYPLKKRENLKGLLEFCPYHWIDGVKEFSVSSNIQRGCKYYQGVIHNTYHGGNIENDHQVKCSISKGSAKHFVFPKFIASGPGTLR